MYSINQTVSNQLPYRQYLLYRKDSWVKGLKESEDGREFLKALYRLNQTKADLKKIRERG